LDFTISLADKFKDVNKRLISALGIDTSNENVRIEWDQFLNLKCFLEIFTIVGEDLENLWLRTLDPKGLSLVPIEDYKEFLERIARGSMSNQPTAVSETFSQEMMKLMKLENCISEKNSNFIDMTKLKYKIKVEKAIEIELFNQLLKQDCLF